MEKKGSQWRKNFFKSMKLLWKDICDDIPGLCLANGVIMTIKEAKKKGIKKVQDPAKINILTSDGRVVIRKFLLEDIIGKNVTDNAVAMGKEIKDMITSGNLYKSDRFDIDDPNGDLNDNIGELYDKFDDLDNISYSEGGLMIKDNLQMNRLRLRQFTFSESLSVISSMTNTNKAIQEAADLIIDKSELIEGMSKNKINDMVVDKHITEMKNAINPIISAVSKNDVANKTYADTLGTAVSVIMETEANYEAELPTENNLEEVLENIRNENRRLEEESPEISEVYKNRITDTVIGLKDMKDDLVFDPMIDEEGEKKVAVSELRKGSGEAGAIASLVNVGLFSGFKSIFDIVLQSIKGNNIANFEKKYGSTNDITQPLIASNRLNSATVRALCKAYEVKTAIRVKATLESSFAAMDGGFVTKRLRHMNFLSPSKIEIDKYKLFKDAPMKYSEILSVFSEKANVEMYNKMGLGEMSSDMLYVLPSMLNTFRNNPRDLDLARLKTHIIGSGEKSSLEIEAKRTALPTYLNVAIQHTTTKGEHRKIDTVVGVEITPKVLDYKEILKTIKENSFGSINVSREERTFMSQALNALKFWEKKSTGNAAKVIKAKEVKNVMDRVKHIKTPLFHIMLEYQDYLDFKKQGVDLLDRETYGKIMKSLPIISITIVMEDTEMVYYSEGDNMAYSKKPLKDYVDATAELEKELRSDIRFRNSL